MHRAPLAKRVARADPDPGAGRVMVEAERLRRKTYARKRIDYVALTDVRGPHDVHMPAQPAARRDADRAHRAVEHAVRADEDVLRNRHVAEYRCTCIQGFHGTEIV